MVLDNLNLEVGEFCNVDELYVFRNEYAYVVLRQYSEMDNDDQTILVIDDKMYVAKTVEDLRSYQSDDFR